MTRLLEGPGHRLFRMCVPEVTCGRGVLPIDLSDLPSEVASEYSEPDAEYSDYLWVKLAHAGVEDIRWTHGPLNHILDGYWISEPAYETIRRLADNVYSILSFVFDDGVVRRRYHWWRYRGWPMGLDRAADGSRVYPWMIHDECIPPVAKWDDNPTQAIARGEEMTVAVGSFIDRRRVLSLGSKTVVTEPFVSGWRDSNVGREIIERGETDLGFSEWSLGRTAKYRWVDAPEPAGLTMTPEQWFPPGSLVSEPRPEA